MGWRRMLRSGAWVLPISACDGVARAGECWTAACVAVNHGKGWAGGAGRRLTVVSCRRVWECPAGHGVLPSGALPLGMGCCQPLGSCRNGRPHWCRGFFPPRCMPVRGGSSASRPELVHGVFAAVARTGRRQPPFRCAALVHGVLPTTMHAGPGRAQRHPVELVHGVLAGAQTLGSVAAPCEARRSKQGSNADASRCTRTTQMGHGLPHRRGSPGRGAAVTAVNGHAGHRPIRVLCVHRVLHLRKNSFLLCHPPHRSAQRRSARRRVRRVAGREGPAAAGRQHRLGERRLRESAPGEADEHCRRHGQRRRQRGDASQADGEGVPPRAREQGRELRGVRWRVMGHGRALVFAPRFLLRSIISKMQTARNRWVATVGAGIPTDGSA